MILGPMRSEKWMGVVQLRKDKSPSQQVPLSWLLFIFYQFDDDQSSTGKQLKI